MVCEVVSGYICNKEIYSAVGKKLEDTLLSLLDRNFKIITSIITIFSSNFARQKHESLRH